MKVAIVQETVEPGRGGAETSTRQMGSQLAGLGLDVTVLCAARAGRGAPKSPFEEDGVRYQPLAAPGANRTLRSYRFMRSALHACQSGGFDVVHAITPCLVADVYQPRGGTLPETVRRSTAMVRRPLLRRLRRLGKLFNLRQRLLCRIERRLLTRGAAVQIAAVSDYVRRQVLADYHVPPQRVHVVFNGVEVSPLGEAERAVLRAELRGQVGLPADARVVLFVAHNFRLKGLTELMRALAVRPGGRRGPRLAVIGRDGPGRYIQLARRLGLSERVRFHGAQRDLRPWYAAADVLAHPTWYDPCSRVVLEALGLGLPVVTTRWNGAAEVLRPGTHGEIVETPADIEGLAAAIDRALDPAIACACRADAPRLCEHISMRRHARELLALYEQIIAARATRAASAGRATF